MKKVILHISLVSLSVFVIFSCLERFIQNIYASTDCERYNIDHIELRTGINIPATISYHCEYDELTKIKKSEFLLDSVKVNLTKWVSKNKFLPSDDHYVHVGQHQNHEWAAAYKPKSQKLYIELIYKNI